MSRTIIKLLLMIASSSSAWIGLSVQALDPKIPGRGEQGTIKSLAIETGRSKDNGFTLAGREAGQQLLINGQLLNGQVRDVTRQVQFEATPAEIVSIDATGYVTALREGKALIKVKGPAGLSASTTITVTDITRDVPVHFANDIVPIFTRFGCNSGGCHGKSGGQNGFQLSLLGFEPGDDYDFLVKEGRGQRRILPAAPEHSLLLQKATGTMPHGGGRKIQVDSPFYRVLRRWVEQGTPYGQAGDAVIQRIEVLPRERLLTSESNQQLVVVAHYIDGATKDVTRLTQFESNNTDLATVSETGLVSTKQQPGNAAIMTRFQTHVDVFRLTVPLGVAVANLPASKNFIDDLVFKQLTKLGLPPSSLCDEPTFLRRVTLDLAGRLPTLEETEKYLADKGPDKRDQLVDRLLASSDYADYFASKWSAVLRNKRETPKADSKPTFAFHAWIKDSLAANKPFDRFVREILTATGEEVQNPPVAWYREVKDVTAQVEDAAQLFLGTRIQCARCHHHPLEKWSQQDYYGLAAFFGQLKYKVPPKEELKKGQKKPKDAPPPPTHVFHKDGLASVINPRTGQAVKPTVLGGAPADIPADLDPRGKLVDWMVSKDNPYFAHTLANRYWKHFFGRGLADPEDDLRSTNPATNPELLDALAKHFVDHQFDLKKMVRTICTSRVYQLSSVANDHNHNDRHNFSRFVPRRLNAEVLFDAIDQVTLANSEFPGIPAGTRAVQLPDNAFESYFLTVFGRPDASSACECERSTEVNLSQLLHLMNSAEILAKVSGTIPKTPGKVDPKGKKGPATAGPKTKIVPGERAAKLAKDTRPHKDKIRELYMVALSREPTSDEISLVQAYIQRHEANVRGAYEDILWVLINSEEFLFNH